MNVQNLRQWNDKISKVILDTESDFTINDLNERPSVKVTEIMQTITVRLFKVNLFKRLFDFSRLDVKTLIESLNPEMNREMVFNSGEGAGKSGSFFFFSHDKRFIIKTMRKREVKTFLQILPQYVDYLLKNPFSMIAKIFGVYIVEKQGVGVVRVMLMENTMQLENKNNLRHW